MAAMARSAPHRAALRTGCNYLKNRSRPICSKSATPSHSEVAACALFRGAKPGKDRRRVATPAQKGQPLYPNVYQPPPPELTPLQREQLKLGTALRNIGWLSFWSQLILSTVSGIILLFSAGTSASGALSVNTMDVFTLIGVAGGLITSFLSWTWIRTGRRLAALEDIKVQRVLGSVLASTNINLASMGATILGLQATVGGLVGKTLTAAAGGYYGPRGGPPPVAFDVFSVQACANTIMAHFAGLVLANWLLRVVQKYVQKEEELAYAPSAPPMPGY